MQYFNLTLKPASNYSKQNNIFQYDKNMFFWNDVLTDFIPKLESNFFTKSFKDLFNPTHTPLYCFNGFCFSSESINVFLNQIPIYFVDKSLSGETVHINSININKEIYIPVDRCVDVSNQEDISNIELGLEEDVANSKDEGLNLKKGDICIFDYFGVYYRRGSLVPFKPKGNNNQVKECDVAIFVWLDKIKKYANGNKRYANALLLQVIVHELIHALMDVEMVRISSKCLIDKEFRFLREESIANGLSLHLIYPILNADEFNFVLNFVKGQPLAYKLGLEYYDSRSLCKAAVKSWASQKNNYKTDKKTVDDWKGLVKGNRPLDKAKMREYEDKFS